MQEKCTISLQIPIHVDDSGPHSKVPTYPCRVGSLRHLESTDLLGFEIMCMSICKKSSIRYASFPPSKKMTKKHIKGTRSQQVCTRISLPVAELSSDLGRWVSRDMAPIGGPYSSFQEWIEFLVLSDFFRNWGIHIRKLDICVVNSRACQCLYNTVEASISKKSTGIKAGQKTVVG